MTSENTSVQYASSLDLKTSADGALTTTAGSLFKGSVTTQLAQEEGAVNEQLLTGEETCKCQNITKKKLQETTRVAFDQSRATNGRCAR